MRSTDEAMALDRYALGMQGEDMIPRCDLCAGGAWNCAWLYR